MSEQPNVVVFFTDQQRWDTTGAHGNPMGLTPTFDRLAQRGRHVEMSFTCQPVCAPARATLQTGLYPTTTGVFRNSVPLPHDVSTLARLFGAAGYDTAYVGKWHLGGEDEVGPVAPEGRGGYETWRAANLLEFTSHAYDTTLYDEQGTPLHLDGYRADAVTEVAIDYVTARHERPFYLFCSLLEPHHQNDADDYPAPEGYAARYADPWVPEDLAALGGTSAEHLPGYYGMVRRVDEALGRLVDALDGLDRDTVLLVTSDHGCHFKTRNDEYKRSCHDASLRVPTVLTGPGLDGAGPVRGPASHVDLPPTLLEAAGLPVPAALQGTSLLGDARPEEVLVQISESEVGRALRTPRWTYAVLAPGLDAWATPSSPDYVEAHLFDNEADPAQLSDRVDDPALADVRAALRQRLVERMVAAGEAAPRILTAPRGA